MNTHTHSKIPATATLLLLLMSGATATSAAQNPKPAPGQMPAHKKVMKPMEGMPGMSAMMGAPHHVLAMAYRDNMATFARALGGQVTMATTVDLDLARTAMAEMRRSFDQMRQHHQAQMTMMMGAKPDSSMSGMMQRMETGLTALGDHLVALESEVNASTPDPSKVSQHTTEILKACADMPAMHTKATSRSPK